MYGLDNTRAGLNLVNIEYHQSVTELHPNLVLKFAYLKDMDGVDTLNISGVDVEKESEQVKSGVDISAVITYKTPFVVNGKPVTVSLAIGEGMACKKICSWPLLQTIKASIMTKKNALVSGLLREQFRLDTMVTKRSNESTKTLEEIPVSLPVTTQ